MDADQPLVPYGPLTWFEYIDKLYDGLRDACPVVQDDAALAEFRRIYQEMERNYLDSLDRDMPLDEFKLDFKYFAPAEAKRLLFGFMNDRGYFTNHVGCVQYMSATERKAPEIERKITIGEVTKRVHLKLSRLAVMAYHSRSAITAMCRKTGVASHRCNNTLCYNPDHVVVESPTENASRQTCPTTYRKIVYELDGKTRARYIGEDLCEHSPKCIRVEWKYKVVKDTREPLVPEADDTPSDV